MHAQDDVCYSLLLAFYEDDIFHFSLWTLYTLLYSLVGITDGKDSDSSKSMKGTYHHIPVKLTFAIHCNYCILLIVIMIVLTQ
jgi:hypothetical protein